MTGNGQLVDELIEITRDLRRKYNNLWLEFREYYEKTEDELGCFEQCKRTCPNCYGWSDDRAKHCHVCEGNRVIYLKEEP